MTDTITIDGITLTHRLFYESGFPTGVTTGRKDGRDYWLERDSRTEGKPWTICYRDSGQICFRHLSPAKAVEYQALLDKGCGRGRQVDHEITTDDLTVEVEAGRMIGGGPADI